MISGRVNSEYEPIVCIVLCHANGQTQTQNVIVDTGFDGWLSLPSTLISKLELAWDRRGRAILADGSESIFDIYKATVIWDDKLLEISVDEADSDPLLGMSLMEGYELTVRVTDGGTVTLKKF